MVRIGATGRRPALYLDSGANIVVNTSVVVDRVVHVRHVLRQRAVKVVGALGALLPKLRGGMELPLPRRCWLGLRGEPGVRGGWINILCF